MWRSTPIGGPVFTQVDVSSLLILTGRSRHKLRQMARRALYVRLTGRVLSRSPGNLYRELDLRNY